MSCRTIAVTTDIQGCQKSHIWHGTEPLPIGHPFRWAIENTEDGVLIRDVQSASAKVHKIGVDELAKGTTFALADNITCRLRAIERTLDNPVHFTLTSCPAATLDPEFAWFKRSLIYTAISLIGFIIIAWVWPKATPAPDELIPPEFAKIVLTPPKKEAAAPSGGDKAQAAPKKASEAAVVQAFRAKALQSAVKGLLKGGLTNLMAQSDFVMGTGGVASAGRIFDAKSEGLQATAPGTGVANGRQVRVGAIGGGSGGGGTGVGYGKGTRAGVGGQGQSLVSMDIEGSSVEEGLTKDEVGAVIHQHMSEIRYCYESAMIRTPDLEGKLMIDFTIGGTGAVKSAAVKSSTLSDPRLDDCIMRRLLTWKFPTPKGGTDVAVAYPFIFKSLGR